MAKWYGKIGYAQTVETSPDVWEKQFTERCYYGDIISHQYRRQSGEGLNDNITLSNQISVIADRFAYENFNAMCYVEFMGVTWRISHVDVQYPRLTLTVGEVYHA